MLWAIHRVSTALQQRETPSLTASPTSKVITPSNTCEQRCGHFTSNAGQHPATTSGGVAGSLAGTIASDGAMTITAGGAGTTATGQVVLSLEID